MFVSHSLCVEAKIAPASPDVQVRALALLTRSSRAANTFPLAPELIRGTVWARNVPQRVRRAGMAFARHVLETADDAQLLGVAPHLLEQLLDMCEQQGELFAQRDFSRTPSESADGNSMQRGAPQDDNVSLMSTGGDDDDNEGAIMTVRFCVSFPCEVLFSKCG